MKFPPRISVGSATLPVLLRAVFPPMRLPFRLIHLLGVIVQKAALPEINAEQPDAWQAVCGALLLQTGRAHLETH